MQQAVQVHTAVSVKRKGKHRRRRRPPTTIAWWSVATLCMAVLCGSITAAVALARPQFKETFNPASNLATLRLLPGTGPLADWTYRHARLQVDTSYSGETRLPVTSSSTHRLVIHMVPSETISYYADAIEPLWPKTSWVGAITAPQAPKVLWQRLSQNSESIAWNTAIVSVRGERGITATITGTGRTVVTLRRPLSIPANLVLQVIGQNGEISHLKMVDPAVQPDPVYYFGSPSGRRIYITVDDGWDPPTSVLDLMRRTHLPITAFLTEQAVVLHKNYWQAFVAAGGVIEDHTVSHPWLTKVNASQAEHEWSQPVNDYARWFGKSPTLGRPPFGASNDRVLRTATAAGLRAVVMWSASFNPSNPATGLQTWNRRPLAPGEIILLHWQKGLLQQLLQIVSICHAEHLVPALLTQGLPASPNSSLVHSAHE